MAVKKLRWERVKVKGYSDSLHAYDAKSGDWFASIEETLEYEVSFADDKWDGEFDIESEYNIRKTNDSDAKAALAEAKKYVRFVRRQK